MYTYRYRMAKIDDLRSRISYALCANPLPGPTDNGRMADGTSVGKGELRYSHGVSPRSSATIDSAILECDSIHLIVTRVDKSAVEKGVTSRARDY